MCFLPQSFRPTSAGATFNGSGALALTQAKAKVSKAGDRSDLVTTEGSARQHGRVPVAGGRHLVETTCGEPARAQDPVGLDLVPVGVDVVLGAQRTRHGRSCFEESGEFDGAPGRTSCT